MTKSLTSWLVPSFSQHNLRLVVSGRCLHVSVTKFQDKFASLRQINSPYSWNKFQICCTDMYLIRFLPNFAVFFVFLWITRDFADLPEFHGSATARKIRSPVFICTSCYSHINKPVNRFICMWKQDDLQKKNNNNKVPSSLAPIQRLGHSAQNCKNGLLSFSHSQAVKSTILKNFAFF